MITPLPLQEHKEVIPIPLLNRGGARSRLPRGALSVWFSCSVSCSFDLSPFTSDCVSDGLPLFGPTFFFLLISCHSTYNQHNLVRRLLSNYSRTSRRIEEKAMRTIGLLRRCYINSQRINSLRPTYNLMHLMFMSKQTTYKRGTLQMC